MLAYVGETWTICQYYYIDASYWYVVSEKNAENAMEKVSETILNKARTSLSFMKTSRKRHATFICRAMTSQGLEHVTINGTLGRKTERRQIQGEYDG